MNTRYPPPGSGSEFEIKRELCEMGIDLFEPLSGSEQTLARLFEEFSDFVLSEERERCLQILQDDIDSDGAGASVGELQGGNDSFSIYRVSFPHDDGDDDDSYSSNNAANQLLKEFNQAHGNRNKLTTRKIKQYMLGMCERRTREREEWKYTNLGNLMFIMQFGGPTEGQVRHIDNMVPNIQICLYMSSSCPSTIAYAMDDEGGEPVANGGLLVKYWERNGHTVPELIKDILWKKSDRKLKGKWYTKYFAFWNTIDSNLACFGKLYQPVKFQLGVQTDPGATLLAGGNEVHAGPPTTGPRMFAFAIGIPEESATASEDEHGEDGVLDEPNDGEVQYSPVLLHIDFCCLLFSLLDHEYPTADDVREAKLFLLEILLHLIRDYPMKAYLRQIDEERIGVRNWLENILDSLDDKRAVEMLVTKAADSDVIFFSPDVIKRRAKKKKRRNPKAK